MPSEEFDEDLFFTPHPHHEKERDGYRRTEFGAPGRPEGCPMPTGAMHVVCSVQNDQDLMVLTYFSGNRVCRFVLLRGGHPRCAGETVLQADPLTRTDLDRSARDIYGEIQRHPGPPGRILRW